MINEIEINSDRFAQVRNARNTETAEDYTEMIADLIRETGEARAVDLAKHFGVTGPTVNSIIRRLVREGLVESRPYRSIFLTEKGKLLADYCKKRHEIVYNFLIKIGVNEEVAKKNNKTKKTRQSNKANSGGFWIFILISGFLGLIASSLIFNLFSDSSQNQTPKQELIKKTK